MGPSYHYFWTAKIGSSILTRIHISLVDEAWGMKVTSTSRRLRWIIKMIAQMNSAQIFKVFWRPSNIHIHIFMLSSWAVFKKVQKSYYFNYYFNDENNTLPKIIHLLRQWELSTKSKNYTGCSCAQFLSQASSFVDPSFSSVDLTFVTNSSDICIPPSP